MKSSVSSTIGTNETSSRGEQGEALAAVKVDDARRDSGGSESAADEGRPHWSLGRSALRSSSRAPVHHLVRRSLSSKASQVATSSEAALPEWSAHGLHDPRPANARRRACRATSAPKEARSVRRGQRIPAREARRLRRSDRDAVMRRPRGRRRWRCRAPRACRSAVRLRRPGRDAIPCTAERRAAWSSVSSATRSRSRAMRGGRAERIADASPRMSWTSKRCPERARAVLAGRVGDHDRVDLALGERRRDSRTPRSAGDPMPAVHRVADLQEGSSGSALRAGRCSCRRSIAWRQGSSSCAATSPPRRRPQ